MRRVIFFFLILVVYLEVPHQVVAQGDDQETAKPTTVHIVQRGENLYRIAQQYGTSVNAIVTANGILDPRFVEVGQRLLIPNAQPDNPGVITAHTVQPGETLHTVAIRYQTTTEDLSRRNDVLNPTRLYTGQVLQINQTGDEPLDSVRVYTVQTKDTLYRIAARFGMPVTVLARANRWTSPPQLFAGQIVIIPGQTSSSLVSLPLPLLDLTLGPLPAMQGQTLSLQFQTIEPVQAEVAFMGRPVNVASLENNRYAALLGIHAMAEPDVYELVIRLTRSDASVLEYPIQFEVIEGNYGFETIAIPNERQDLLDGGTVQAELDKVATIMSQFTPEAYFEGLWSLPAPGSVTSAFGTRRSYNGTETVTFHGGADFGGAVGMQITAPAAGTVVLVEPLLVRGNVVIIDHGWGVYTGYWHQAESYVTTGQFVQKGDVIGAIGSTGLSTGAHLHWEMWVSGVQVDPLQWAKIRFP
ncbi:MAG: LysM peptidoglycan-binding domain-containing protein [Chloroflexi bacterium]|nr:LysM peptidoglycan-binding domain-containing protein [Chloroflexota bacterium]